MQRHRVSSSPVLTWQLLQDESISFSCEVCSTPLTPHVQHLCCALTLCWGERKMLSLGIPLLWSFGSLLLVWRSSAWSTAPPLCMGSGHTVQHEIGLCQAGGSGWNMGSSAKQKYRYSDRISDKLCDYYLILCVFAAVVLL